MSERMTIVFDDESIARRLRVRAAEDGVSMKWLIEEALRAYLGPELAAPKPFDWAAYDRFQEELKALPEETEEYPPVLRRLGAEHPRLLMLAEEATEYDAGQP